MFSCQEIGSNTSSRQTKDRCQHFFWIADNPVGKPGPGTLVVVISLVIRIGCALSDNRLIGCRDETDMGLLHCFNTYWTTVD